MPTIISDTGNGNIKAIRKYFCAETTIQKIAQITGIAYSALTDGHYKLLLEPIGYFTFNGYKMAATATEVALYDQMLSGGVWSRLKSFSHQNLPLSMFLQYADLQHFHFKLRNNLCSSPAFGGGGTQIHLHNQLELL